MQEIKHIEDILLELVEADGFGEQEVVAAIERYPEHRESILAFYIEWLADDDGKGAPPIPPGEGGSDLSKLWDQEIDAANPFESQRPAALKSIAEKCDIPLSILVRIEERAIHATSLPLILIRRLAEELKTTASSLLQFLEQDQAMTASDFRSDKAPVQRAKLSFADAIRKTSMPEDKKQKWLDLSE
ncbi:MULTISPECIES: hypothetical protein [Sinorhizobium/Ensifer group]|jgi:hypothetical protein|uniref:hypothetical protein n=1 Tax=Sinorhizobium/Ensifer group TaxID=227292 RepID=UPI00071D1E9F|nr:MULTISPECIES: hypothetical protein [Sinorhizobium/Ensifer group]KSV81805.1 hypothetical protein N183_14935 [Sinorhizobium sp. Sb3]